MRLSQLYGQTLREVPADIESVSHQLLLRSGFIHQFGAGVFSLLPLGMCALTHIICLLRQELEVIGGQEIALPGIQPTELWLESTANTILENEKTKFQDHYNKNLFLSTHGTMAVMDLTRHVIHSYKQLPRVVYHFKKHWQNGLQPHAGLLRLRESVVLESYSLDADTEGLQKNYMAHKQAMMNIFKHLDLPVVEASFDSRLFKEFTDTEFYYLTSAGDQSILICPNCAYKANRLIACFKKTPLPPETSLEIEKIATPDTMTIQALADLLNIPKSKTAKAVFFMAQSLQDNLGQEKLIFAVVRGDMEVNETKLSRLLNGSLLRPATDEEIRFVGATPGYASPIGLRNVLVVVDDLVPTSSNLVAGANEVGFHLLNVNYGRDYQADMVADITLAADNSPCPVCGSSMKAETGICVGTLVYLADRIAAHPMNCSFLNKDGVQKPVLLGAYAMEIERLLACVAEEHHDDKGLIFPLRVAPYFVHLISLRGGEAAAEKIYTRLMDEKIDVLFDDRDESPGVKFHDADLIGIPLRITISARSLNNAGVEWKMRNEAQREIVPIGDIVNKIEQQIHQE